MRLHAWNTIVEKENVDQKAKLQSRKHHLSRKRRAIERKHLMTGAELVEIQAAEELTKQRKAPKKVTGKRKGPKSWAKMESSDECDEYVDTSDDEVEILDCIEVEP